MIEEVTREFLENLKTEEGGYTREALAMLGVPWPAPHGWKHEIIGKLISVDPEDFERARYTRKQWEARCRAIEALDRKIRRDWKSTGPFNPKPTMPR